MSDRWLEQALVWLNANFNCAYQDDDVDRLAAALRSAYERGLEDAAEKALSLQPDGVQKWVNATDEDAHRWDAFEDAAKAIRSLKAGKGG